MDLVMSLTPTALMPVFSLSIPTTLTTLQLQLSRDLIFPSTLPVLFPIALRSPMFTFTSTGTELPSMTRTTPKTTPMTPHTTTPSSGLSHLTLHLVHMISTLPELETPPKDQELKSALKPR